MRLACLCCLIICTLTARSQAPQDGGRWTRLGSAFGGPSDTIQTSVYWYWISGNVSEQGVVRDLESMKRAGITRAFIGNIGMEDEIPSGGVRLLSPQWWSILHTALKTATRLHIDIGIFNGPGWSQSGGPWIQPGQSMRYLTASETQIAGSRSVDTLLAAPIDRFQDTRVIAFPAPLGYNRDIRVLHPSVSATPTMNSPSNIIDSLSNIMDGRCETEARLGDGDSVSVEVRVASEFTARSLVIWPGRRRMTLEGTVEVEEDGRYKTVSTFVLDRSNDALNTGFDPYGPLAVSLPAATGRTFRIVLRHWSKGAGIGEMILGETPVVANFVEKTLAKMYPTPLPYWKEYQWPAQPETTDPGMVIDPAQVRDISASMDKSGRLRWTAPPGDWIVLREGMTPTGVTNAPASPEGRGLEVDKMSKAHVAEHFNAFIGQILEHIPEADRRCFKVVVEDSYETGGQNWTDDMIPAFKARYGYDPLPYMPAIQGNVVGSEDRSDRFLWDLRRFIADKVAYDYVGGLREVSHRHGLTTWLENYGHWGFPAEFLQYGGQSDEVSGEFWSEGDLGNIENRAASSSAHIYGKTKVSAESFTAGGRTYARYPALLKPRGDRFFTEGINNNLLHVYISQPDDRLPGINAWFGTEFNRHNTWFSQMDLFTAYLKRCDLMLQQGRYVADVAYFIGEDAPKMTGVRVPELPKGYAYDYINAEVIERRLSVRDGRWTLPDGLSYRILVLPQLKTMRPEVLRRLLDLVRQGGILLGPPPDHSPSLEDYGQADTRVRQMAADLWGSIDGSSVKTHVVGKGMVIDGLDMQEALSLVNDRPDCLTAPGDSVLFIHRTEAGGDIYFLSNQSGGRVRIEPTLRVTTGVPYLWDPLTGKTRALPSYTRDSATTRLPLQLEAYQSFFIVFRKDLAGPRPGVRTAANPVAAPHASAAPYGSAASHGSAAPDNFPTPAAIADIASPWQVRFDTAFRGPAHPVIFPQLADWSKDAKDSIRDYSGAAVYTNTFVLPKGAPRKHVYLDLGAVRDMAKVRVNGIYVGGVWTAPYRVDIGEALHAGKNRVEITVVNTWVNRLIGDSRLPVSERKTWMSANPYRPNSPYEPAGLLGPVRVVALPY